MFILTAKINKRKLAVLLSCALVVCGGILAASLWGLRPASAPAQVSPKGVKTAQDRTAYLQGWGWLVAEEPSLVEELMMPEEFGPDYDRYLALQRAQGFDLTKYAGQRIKRYTYEVLNYPTGDTGVVAHLLLCKDRVIGGEIMGSHFLHGLEIPQPTADRL